MPKPKILRTDKFLYIIEQKLPELTKIADVVTADDDREDTIAKGAVDALAVGTGLGHRLSPQRADRMSAAEAREWRQVWESLDPGLLASGRSQR